jgi:uncharacterized protein
MKYFYSISFCIFFSLIISEKSKAQDPAVDSTSSEFIIRQGIELYDNDSCEDALKFYRQISVCDPNYWWACYESALALYDLNRTSEAFNKVKEAIDLNPDDVNCYTLEGSILDDLLRSDEAIELLRNALVRWPYNQRLYYNLALCYINKGNPEEAEKLLFRSIALNPYHRTSHFLLARANLMMGRMGQADLAFCMAILLNPSTSYLTAYENTITGKSDSLNFQYLHPYPPGTDHRKWDDLSRLMNSGLAFSNDFEYKYDVNYMTSRQSYMLFRKIAFDPADTSLYNRFYVRFFSELMQKDYFEPWLYYSYKETNDKNIPGWINEHQKQVKEFTSWATRFIDTGRESGFSLSNEQNQLAIYHFDENGKLESTGKMKKGPEPVKTGSWVLINSDGGKDGTGNYLENKREGKWTFYHPDNSISQQLVYHNGELDSICITYFPNGVKSGVYPRINGKQEGTETEYTPSGNILSSTNYVDDLQEGKETIYYYADGFLRESNYNKGLQNGKFTEKWLNGNIRTEAAFADSLREGPFKIYYPTGAIKSEGIYKADIQVGKWADYYPNGVKSAEGERDEQGKLSGSKINYTRDGKISLTETYAGGLLDGISTTYFENGAIKSRIEFKDDTIMAVDCFDDKGTELYKSRSANGILVCRIFYPDGIPEMEGTFKNGQKTGIWKIYDPLGRISEESSYENGLLHGLQKTFHENGRVKEEYMADSNLIMGIASEYYSSGQLKSKGSFNKKGRNGEWITWFSNDSIASRSCYSDGVLVGRNIIYSPDGKKLTEEFFSNDGKSIRSKTYDPSGKLLTDEKYRYDSLTEIRRYHSGQLLSKRTIVDNTVQGADETYYPNGKLLGRKTFIYGNIDGIIVKYDISGQKEFEAPYFIGTAFGARKGYNAGKPDFTDQQEEDLSQGYYREYHDNGRIAVQTRYVDDKRHGYSDFFSPDSILMFRLIYFEGVLKAYTCKDKTGTLLPETPVTTSTTEIVCHYPDGTISARITMKQGLLDGPYTTYYPDGKTMKEKVFVQGDLEGPYKSYFPNGKLKELINYHLDERDGTYEKYFLNGTKKVTGTYMAGQLTGEWNFTDESGRPLATLYYINDEIYDCK